VLTIITVSALVLWHEQQVLSSELEAQGDLLARLLALSAGDGGSPEYLAILSMTDLAAGEVRAADGGVLWRYGPPLDEVETLGGSFLRVDRRVEVAAGPWGSSQAVPARISPMTMEAAPSIQYMPVIWLNHIPTKATMIPAMAAESSSRTTKVVGSLLSRTAWNRFFFPRIFENSLKAKYQAAPSKTKARARTR